MTWKPHVTVAAIAERDGHFLLVEEIAGGKAVINQPAGHLEPGEGLIDAVIRETREETAWEFLPRALVGVYRWVLPSRGTTYLRFTFTGECTAHDPQLPLDDGILRALWLAPEELEARRAQLRTPLILRSIADYRAGRRYPLELLGEPPP